MKTHLKQSPEPLKIAPGEVLIAECGKPVPNVYWFFIFDGEICGSNLRAALADLEAADEESGINRLNLCPKCLRVQFTERYLSGIRSRSGAESVVEESA